MPSTAPGSWTTCWSSRPRLAACLTRSCCPRSTDLRRFASSTCCSPSSRRATASRSPILIHAILETAQGVSNVEAIAQSSPRLQGMSLGPSDLAASRRMKTTRVGGPHPGYVVRDDADPDDDSAPRTPYIQDPWHYTLARMVDACAANEIYPFYGPFGDFSDPCRLRGSVPRRLHSRLRRRMDAASQPDSDCQGCLPPQPRRGALRPPRGRCDARSRRLGRRRRRRRQDARRRHLQAVPSPARTRRHAVGEGSRAGCAIRVVTWNGPSP